MINQKLLFIHPGMSTFVKKDFDFLNSKFTVRKFYYRHSKSLIKHFIEQIRLFSWLSYQIWWCKSIFIWFGDYHAFLPVVFGKITHKKTIIIVGGYDAVSIPCIEFGLFYKKNPAIRILLTKLAYIFANYILPVDKSLIKGTNSYIDEKILPIGIKSFIKNIKARFYIIPTGYSSKKWYKKESLSDKNTILTIGIASNIRTFVRKGFDLFFEIAKNMPQSNFVIIGLKGEMLKYAKSIATPNIKIFSIVKNNELIVHYSSAKVFCQLSMSEGLPNTLCEAMLCECIPVGSNVNGIPDAIDNCGFILMKKNIDEAVALAQKALNSEANLGKQARNRIIEKYSIEKRENSLLSIIRASCKISF
ncbi:MAG: glycosyltransferase family 4 protein [Candidatus Marinimicrobia bacterium]|nr:glycosyltransferase family 4 protein [Candidatus Neomarinimicrobiota bacterium]